MKSAEQISKSRRKAGAASARVRRSKGLVISGFSKRPERDATYLAFVRRLPCLLCNPSFTRMLLIAAFADIEEAINRVSIGSTQSSRTEAAHTGDHGIGIKSDDRTAIPLCGMAHHREGPLSIHKLGKHFWARHSLNRDELLNALARQYAATKATA